MRMKNTDYKPKPIDTAGVVLDPSLNALVEALAENVHDIWAANRMSEGWAYGPQRDDQRKLHPCLVPYGALPESERKYDRDSAVETLRVICKMGYRISRG